MQNLEMEVLTYFKEVVEERLANDPIRRNAFWNVVRYLGTNHSSTASQRFAMIHNMVGIYNQDLAHVLYTLTEGEYHDILLHSSPLHFRAARIYKAAMMCLCIQFMDLFRHRLPVNEPLYSRLCNAVHLFNTDQITEPQLRVYFYQVFNQFPAFRIELQARVDRLTSLFNLGDGGSSGGASHNPGRGNPPPQV